MKPALKESAESVSGLCAPERGKSPLIYGEPYREACL